jgi:hypothetical protein
VRRWQYCPVTPTTDPHLRSDRPSARGGCAQGALAQRRRPWPALAGLVAAVLVAHAVLLAGLPSGVRAAVGAQPLRFSVVALAPARVADTTRPAAPSTGGAEPSHRVPHADVSPAPVKRATAAPKPAPDEPPSAVLAQPLPAIAANATVATLDTVAAPADVPTESSHLSWQESSPVTLQDVPQETHQVVPQVVSQVAPQDSPSAAPMPAGFDATRVAAAGVAKAAEPVGSAGPPPPVYPTRVPQPAVLHYELRRGVLAGQGVLTWQPTAQGYDMQIEGTVFGLPVLSWISRGGFDAAGLAPQRFIDRRRGKDQRAANFQRDKGLISWSSVTTETPLVAGAQDRLSWMAQLAAIVQADRKRYGAGTQVVMQVAGARGDADVWTFSVTGRESVDVMGGRVLDTLALRREPRKPFDTQVEVWLDPARQHLPVRLKLSSSGGNDALEFLLRP